jgi:hypothetical protein
VDVPFSVGLCAKYMHAGFRPPPSPPPRPHSAARMFSVLCTCHSLIYPRSCRWETCSDAHACAPSSVSTVALGCLARVYFLSLTSLPLLQINAYALNPTLSPTLNATGTRVRHCAPTRAVPPSSPIMYMQAHCNLALAPVCSSPPAAVPAGWVSVDLRGVFSHGHLGECVCCNVA